VPARDAPDPDTGYPITAPDTEALPETEPGFTLDRDVIEAKFAETAAVGALLADIFKEDESEHSPTANGPTTLDGVTAAEPAAATSADALFEGLDVAHSAFLRALLTQETWSRGELEELAEEHNLMPDGALDTINEFALDLAGEPLLEEDVPDTFTINDYAREELPA
jgi:hypothetical protein